MAAIEVFEVARRERWEESPWLLLGKGPSFSAVALLERIEERIICLNHAVAALERLTQVRYDRSRTVAHCVDSEVVEECGDSILRGARYLLMPWIPNREFRRGDKTLDEWSAENRVLQILDEQRRLLWYNRAGSRELRPGSPAIPVEFFSSEGAVGVLARAGVKRIRTAGLDGGQSYANEFQQHPPLQNGRATFDDQFPPLRQIVQQFGIDFPPLACTECP